jgi:hypothetical protein
MTADKVRQSKVEIREHLREQVGFILASIEQFDGGQVAEAKRMATHIRTLLHDGQGQSLFAQLGLKKRLLFYDTVKDDLANPQIAHALGLVGLQLSHGPSGPKAKWFPALDPGNLPDGASRRRFHDWWTRWVMKDSPATGFSRRDIVLPIANQDGGAHVDPNLDKRYADLSRLNSMRWLANTGGGPAPMPNVELMCVRHIAHEVLVALACQVDWSFLDEGTRLKYAREKLHIDGGTGSLVSVGQRPSFDRMKAVT